jgi:glycyl-tRNA synthetase beta chain
VGGVSDFLLELLSEEIPARMQAKAKADLARLFNEALAKAGLKADSVETFATPRRLALIAKGLPTETRAVSEETKGPKTGAPPQAMEGFLRKVGLTQDQLVERDGIYFAVVEKPGRKTAEVLAEAIPAMIRAFPWPKSQRWGAASISTESLRWVRPLQGIVALLGDDLVPCAIDGIESRRTTMGHRFHSSGLVSIANAGNYVEALRAAHVIVHFSERCRIIREGAEAAAKAAGLVLVEDEGLIAENAGLAEWPVPMLGRFDAAFLSVPPEVIQLTARVNQKYFVCHDVLGDFGQGKLANAFVCTANIVANDGGAAIVAGNEKVLAARLSDAKFFWEQDLKVSLQSQAKKLSQITFHEKLGTVADKVERVAKLAEWLVAEGIVKGCSAADARRAAELCKADLVTGMVGEFPELQGIMGGYYARAQGEDDAVADAVRDHYKPVGQGDDVPTAPVTVAVSLADKLDTLEGFFYVGEVPTGSKDPYALRRAAIGVLNLLLKNDISEDASSLALHGVYGASYHEEQTWASSKARVIHELSNFLAQRFGQMLIAQGVSKTWLDAFFTEGDPGFRPVDMRKRIRALQGFIETDAGRDLLAGYKRAANILKQAEWVDGQESVTPDQVRGDAGVVETTLATALDAAEPRAAAAIEAEDFEGAMSALATLRAPIDAFFEGVMVNDPDADRRAFRLGLLARFRHAVHQVADFSKIEG